MKKKEENKIDKREKYLILFVLLALYLSIAESFIPKPFPWMKIGLANIVTLIAMERFDKKMAFEVTFLRIFIQAITLGTIFTPGFIISIVSGGVATLVMAALWRYRDNLSIVSISAVSAFMHNLMQLIVVYFLIFSNISIFSRSIFLFVMIFLGIGIVCGAITGIICEKINIRTVSGKDGVR